MHVETLPSGKFRVKRKYEGKRYNFVFDHVPSDREVERALFVKIRGIPTDSKESLSFKKAVEQYIKLKSSRNSVSTLREYSRLCNHFTTEFCNKDIFKIVQLDVDREIAKWLDDGLSYKTIKNYWSMAQTVITKFGGKIYSIDMIPEKPRKEEPYIPTPDDVKTIMGYIEEHCPNMYIPYWLSAYGLRRGEVCALTPADVDLENGTITISKDMVEDINKNWVIKEPKTQASKRTIAISPKLCQLIVEQGNVYEGHPNSINKALKRAQEHCGIPHFTLHKMRHYCCTELFDMGYTETDVLAYMGWEEQSSVMKQVYKHSRLKNDMEKQRVLADRLTGKIL